MTEALKLDTMARVRREMAAVYRQARAGRLDVTVASKLTFILTSIGRCISDGELERRVEEVERLLAVRAGAGLPRLGP